MAGVVSDLREEAAQQDDQFGSVVCATGALKPCKVTLSKHANAANPQFRELVFKILCIPWAWYLG